MVSSKCDGGNDFVRVVGRSVLGFGVLGFFVFLVFGFWPVVFTFGAVLGFGLRFFFIRQLLSKVVRIRPVKLRLLHYSLNSLSRSLYTLSPSSSRDI